MLIVPRGHRLAGRGLVDKDELYSLRFLSMNTGSSVMKNQEAMLRQQGVSWARCTVDMVSSGEAQAILSCSAAFLCCPISPRFTACLTIAEESHIQLREPKREVPAGRLTLHATYFSRRMPPCQTLAIACCTPRTCR